MNNQPTHPDIPNESFVLIDIPNKFIGVGIVKKGQRGLNPIYDFSSSLSGMERNALLVIAKRIVNKYNKEIGVTAAQSMACLIGCTEGWDKPGANPGYWNLDGSPR